MAAIVVGTTPTQLTGFELDNRIIIQNLGASDIYMGDIATVSTANGIKIVPGGSYEFQTLMWGCPAVWLVSGSAGVDVRWMQIG